MQTQLLKEIRHVLQAFPQFWNGETLKRFDVVTAIENKDPSLIKAFIANEKLKQTYSTDIDGVLFFDFSKLVSLIQYKAYWNDSYTRYKNKIGLTIGGGSYLDYNTDVVLDFPFKDCVLEGGMSKEEVAGKDECTEVYYNEIIASDEIDRLFSPKVLTKVKRYGANGKVEYITQLKDTDNLIIKGNNLLALHSLKERFLGRVKLIYIDPPYNTDSDSFLYNDKFSRSTWLTFMKNRLEVAKELLSDDGAIFVQCDDNEQAYLKVLMDEVFGRKCFKENIVVRTSTPSGVNAINVKRGERLFKVKEYILFYSKNTNYRFNAIYIKSKFNRSYKYSVVKNMETSEYEVIDLTLRFNENELKDYVLKNYENIFSLEKNNRNLCTNKCTKVCKNDIIQ